MLDLQAKITEAKKLFTGNSIANAITRDYFNLYYVDLTDDFFIEIKTNDDSKKVAFITYGFDFFENSKKNMSLIMEQEDFDSFFSKFNKEIITKAIKGDRPYIANYFYHISDVKHFACVKIVKLFPDDDTKIIIATANMDYQLKLQE